MRDAYHEELDSISEHLVEMARLVGSAIGRATTAMLDADLNLAESVIANDDKVDDLQRALETRAIQLLARQQPVATDLRIVVTSLRMSADLERSGDLAQHVAKVARLRFPQSAVPRDLQATLLEMGQLAQRLMAKAAEVIITKDVDLAFQLEQDDDKMDDLHRTLFQHLMDDRWKHGIETAVDVTLLGRYYERFADHAVSVARRVVYLVTGDYADELDPAAAAQAAVPSASAQTGSEQSESGEPTAGQAASAQAGPASDDS
ncbi:phosphate signaling complex protein PhoU [Streptomyces sparsus]